MKRLWYLIANALGEKTGKTNKEADMIALIRLFFILQAVITNVFIVANAIHHWNN